MHLALLRIENFRSCSRVDLALTPFTPIVGYNNAGKSNVMRAAAWLLRGEVLDKADFRDHGANVVVSALIIGIQSENLSEVDEVHRRKIEPFVKNGRLFVRRTLDCTNLKKAGLKLHVAAGDVMDFTQADWKPNPGGIDESLSALFPQPISIEAMADAASDVTKSSASSTIGRLVAEVIDEIKHEHQTTIDASLMGMRDLLDFDGGKRPQALTDLDEAATNALATIFPDIRLRIHVPVPALESIFKGATIRTIEGETTREVSLLGHGVQRSIQIALIRVLSERSRRVCKATNTLLLLDEPELYLHPHAIELTREALKKLSLNGYQVIAATHSPQFVGFDDVPNSVLLRKGEGGTRALGTIGAHAEKIITDKAKQAEALFGLANSSQILFADRVVIVEGNSEQRLIPRLYQAVTGVSAMAERTAIVHLGGSGQIPGAMAILRSLGLVACGVWDLDGACRIAPQHGLIPKDHPALEKAKERFAVLQPSLGFKLNHGWPQKSETCSAEAAFAALASDAEGSDVVRTLHDHFKQRGIWVWTLGSIERHLGLANKDLDTHRVWIERVATDGWQNCVSDQATTRGLIDWMRATSLAGAAAQSRQG